MLPNIRFYIISIVAIFAALGIGIFIGFTMNTQRFVIEQKENISDLIEDQLELLIQENQNLKNNEKTLENEIEIKDKYIALTYEHIVRNKLKGLNVAIIETNSDYVTSAIGMDLELAGAKVNNVTTINNDIINDERLIEVLNRFGLADTRKPVEELVGILTKAIILGNNNIILEELEREGLVETMGNYGEAVDYIIVCGGSKEEPRNRINLVDKVIIEVAEDYNIPILGVEKLNVEYSYMPTYQTFGISTVDNIDTIMGKVAMVLVLEGDSGNYGIKNSFGLIPHYKFSGEY
ncbi:MAG: copper transporter [Tissierellia bacterium]|nr:copper transporter [Tissierellia bacterium]